MNDGTLRGLLARRVEAVAGQQEKDKGSGAYLFPSETDSEPPPAGIQRAHARALRGSRSHSSARTIAATPGASRAVEAGIDLVTLAAMLGR